jgi:serine/threonine protein phosphatase PrpC
MKQVVFGESVQGASHIRTETECQDSFKRVARDDGIVVMAVADGHGSKSCPYSKSGSSIAVNVFCKVIEGFLDSYQGEYERLLTYLNREGEMQFAKTIDDEWKRRVLKIHANNKRDVPLFENGEKNKVEIYKQYGSTLVGLLITPVFLFAFQLGDGDISYVDNNGFEVVLQTEKILGTETHSLSKVDCWKKAISRVQRQTGGLILPSVFILSTDGFANSYKHEQEFQKTCVDYFGMINEHGAEAVSTNLKGWLSETSRMGCGDDITMLMAYYSDAADETDSTAPDVHAETSAPESVSESEVESNNE